MKTASENTFAIKKSPTNCKRNSTYRPPLVAELMPPVLPVVLTKFDQKGHVGVDIDDDVDNSSPSRTKCDKCEIDWFRIKADSIQYAKTKDPNALRKWIYFEWKTKPNCPRGNCVLVQWRKGEYKKINSELFGGLMDQHMKLPFLDPTYRSDDNYISRTTAYGEFNEWTIDSPDLDPVFQTDSLSDRKTIYTLDTRTNSGSQYFSTFDGPSLRKGYLRDYEFNMCMYSSKDVPRVANAKGNTWGKALKCIHWSMRAMYHDNGKLTKLDGKTTIPLDTLSSDPDL